MHFDPLKIGRYEFPVPIVQGGMGVGISGYKLVSAVLKSGGLGTLTPFGQGDLSQGMTSERFISTSREAFKREVLALQSQTALPFAVNYMGALTNIDDLIITGVELGVKIIVFGAGIPFTLPAIVTDSSVALVPIISSARLAQLIIKRWDRYDHRVPDAFIIEGPLAGGHLGFSPDQLRPENIGKFSLENILKETLEIIKPFEQTCGRKIPIIVAGGIYTGEDMAWFLAHGASGVQLGTRFAATYESAASPEFKQAYINARQKDIVIIESPVGMPGRAILNDFLQQLHTGNISKPQCPFHCIHSCKRDSAGFCIAERLNFSLHGKVKEGLLFCGANVYRIDNILSVAELMNELLSGLIASKQEIVL